MAGILKVKIGGTWVDIPAIVGPQGPQGPMGDLGDLVDDVEALKATGLSVENGMIMCTFKEE